MCSRVEQLGRFCHPECGLIIGHGSKIWHRRDWSCGCGQYARSALAVARRSGAATAADSAAGPSRHAPLHKALLLFGGGSSARLGAGVQPVAPIAEDWGGCIFLADVSSSKILPAALRRWPLRELSFPRHAGPARISPRMGPLGGDPPGNAHGDRQLPAPRAHQPLRKRRPCGHPAGLPSQHKPDP